MNTWIKPQFEEISMNAEIGAYQPDGDERDNQPVVGSTRASGAPALLPPVASDAD